MTNDNLPKGYTPIGDKKERKAYWKYILYLFIFLVGANAIKNIKERQLTETVNKKASIAAAAYEQLPKEEVVYAKLLRATVIDIASQYLTAKEIDDWLSICSKLSEGTGTADDIEGANLYWKKIEAAATEEEKKSLNTFSEFAKKLAGMQE